MVNGSCPFRRKILAFLPDPSWIMHKLLRKSKDAFGSGLYIWGTEQKYKEDILKAFKICQMSSALSCAPLQPKHWAPDFVYLKGLREGI